MTSLLHVPVQAPVETEVVTDADVLRRAAYRFDEGIIGWCQGMYRQGNSFCLVGAVHQVAIDSGRPFASRNGDNGELAAHCFAVQHCGRIAISTWNDTSGRTREEVIARLRDAAEKATS